LKVKEERDRHRKEYEVAIVTIFKDSGKTYGPDRICGMLYMAD